MDRKIAPVVEALQPFDYLKARSVKLPNGIPLHYINAGAQEVVKLDLVFDAGYALQYQPLVAAAVNQLLTEGTASHSGEELAELIESKGAFIDHNLQADTSDLSLYCLCKQLPEVLPYILEMISEANFPEHELQNFIENQAQKYSINAQKVSFLAKNEFAAFIFGEKHPYNNRLQPEHFGSLKRGDLLAFYEQFYQKRPFRIYLSGKVERAEIELMEKTLGELPINWSERGKEGDGVFEVSEESFRLIEKADAQQSAIRLGKQIVGKGHPDFPALFFANTLLGGFFGSRLMRNIREEKGYTYGIGSGLLSMKKGSCFFISSELGVDYVKDSLSEIEKEMDRLQTELVSEEELNLVKNYLQGSTMRNFDGAFASMDRFKSINLLGLNYEYYEQLMQVFRQMTAENLREVAKKYLNFKELKMIVAGRD